MITRFVLLVAVLVWLAGSATRGQEEKPDLAKELGWDLSYGSLLKKNKVGANDWLSMWLKGTDRAFPKKLLASWQGERIVASVLIEIPAAHAGEHMVFWLIRTEKKAYVWANVDKGEREPNKAEINTKLLDNSLKSISSWNQAEPSPKDPKADDRNTVPGYFGFLNYFDSKGSRQILLVQEEVYGDRGRVLKLLEPLNRLLRE